MSNSKRNNFFSMESAKATLFPEGSTVKSMGKRLTTTINSKLKSVTGKIELFQSKLDAYEKSLTSGQNFFTKASSKSYGKKLTPAQIAKFNYLQVRIKEKVDLFTTSKNLLEKAISIKDTSTYFTPTKHNPLTGEIVSESVEMFTDQYKELVARGFSTFSQAGKITQTFNKNYLQHSGLDNYNLLMQAYSEVGKGSGKNFSELRGVASYLRRFVGNDEAAFMNLVAPDEDGAIDFNNSDLVSLMMDYMTSSGYGSEGEDYEEWMENEHDAEDYEVLRSKLISAFKKARIDLEDSKNQENIANKAVGLDATIMDDGFI